MITLRDVRKSFRRVEVLSKVTLDVPEGCLYGLMGPGAAGKSILVKIIAGLVEPGGGEVRVAGAELTKMSETERMTVRMGIGMLFQNNALFDHLTVAENIAFPLERLGRARGAALVPGEIRARVEERLACVNLAGYGDRMPRELSGGQKKRVGVARATVTRAPIVLYDEPAAGLDPVTSQKIFDLLRAEQRAMGGTVVMVSSDIDRLLTITDRIGMLYRGELIFDGTTDEAKTSAEPRIRQFLDGRIDGPL